MQAPINIYALAKRLIILSKNDYINKGALSLAPEDKIITYCGRQD
jgi:hypothetical protein